MSSGPAPITETPLATPLPCWHESTFAARHDVIVALSERRARIASGRPVPPGTPVFLEFRTTHPGGAGIDAVAVASDGQAFIVEFIAVDAGAAAVLAEALRPLPPPSMIIEPPAAAVVATSVPAVTSEMPIHDDGDPEAVSVLAPPALAALTPVDVPATERTGEFLTSSLVLPAPAEPDVGHATDVDPADTVARTGEFLPIVSPPLAEPIPAVIVDVVVPLDDLPPAATNADTGVGPSWARALDTDLGDEPELGDVSHTQRWPTARLATSSEDDAVPAGAAEAEGTSSTPASTPASTLAVADAPAPPPPTAKTPPVHDERDETTRWPVARVAVNPEPPPAPVPPLVAASAPPMDFDTGEDVVLEFTAPQRPAVTVPPARPLPPPEDTGVVEVDFSEFRDVLGVATFRSESAPRTALGQRVTTPQPISITLPRTPSTSLQPAPLAVPAKNPFGGDSGVGPRPDSTPPITNPAPVDPAAADQWVVSSPSSLPAPRLLDRDLDRVLRSGGSNSVTPRPIPMYDSSPPMTTPLELAGRVPVAPATTASAAIVSVTNPPTSITSAPTGPASPPADTSPSTSAPPRVVVAARSPFAVPPVSPVVAPRPPSVVPVLVPPRPPVPVTMPPRPAMPSLAPVLATPTVPTVPMAAPTTVAAPVALPASATPPSSTPHAHLLPVTPSAEGLPLIVGADGDDP